ncbi:LysR substrate-binding domain-containing protein [Marilutibacter maris]|nr:LysR family transcriptional regulator [Lysobacter maris]
MKLDSIRSLEAFREIIQRGSATAAAQSLGLSQPAVSRLLGQLEEQLGFALFHRSKGRLLPTAQALMLFEEVDLALQGLDRVAALARDIHDSNAGHLRIVAPPSFAEGPLVKLVAGFLKQHPRIRVNIDSRTRPATMNLVATRTADCGFGKLPLDHPEIRMRPLISSPTVCVLPSAHPLARRKRALTASDLADEALILIGQQGGDTRQRIDQAFREVGRVAKVRMETRNVGAACALAAEGVGIAIVNELLSRNASWMDVSVRRFTPLIPHEYVFLTSAQVPGTPLTEAFYRHCQSTLRGMLRTAPRRPAAR